MDKTSGEVGVGSSEYGAGARARPLQSPSGQRRSALDVGCGRSRLGSRLLLSRIRRHRRAMSDGFKSGTYERPTDLEGVHRDLVRSVARTSGFRPPSSTLLFSDASLPAGRHARAASSCASNPVISSSVQLMSRAHVNYYNFRGMYPRDRGQRRGRARHVRWLLGRRGAARGAHAGQPDCASRWEARPKSHYLVHQTVEDNTGVASSMTTGPIKSRPGTCSRIVLFRARARLSARRAPRPLLDVRLDRSTRAWR